MSGAALALAFGAAVLHAGWNLLVKAGRDRVLSFWAVTLGSAIWNVPVLIVLGLPDAITAPYLAATTVLHVIYGSLLVAAYDRADLAVIYPIARGVAPLLVALGGVLWLGDVVEAVGWIGIALVSLGIVGLAITVGVGSGVGWALLTGLAIASYTTVDGAGVRAGDEAIRYIGSMFVLTGIVWTGVVLGRRGSSRALAHVRSHWREVVLGGLGSAGAYALVMVATLLAPLGLVAGVRETSALIGILGGYRLLREHVSRRHVFAAAVAVTGTILIAVS